MDKRPHYIPELARIHAVSQTDIVERTGADKGTVSRWFNERKMPSPKYRRAIAEMFQLPDEAAIFREPDQVDELTAQRKEIEGLLRELDRESLTLVASVVHRIVQSKE